MTQVDFEKNNLKNNGTLNLVVNQEKQNYAI